MEKINRRPFSNFILKRSIQARITVRIILLVLATSIATSAILGWYYTHKSEAGYYYYMSNDVKQDLELKNILGVILPSLIAAQAVSFIIAFAVGLFSSRKVAVPLYKIERWAQQLSKGNLRTRLMFREKKEMMDIVLACNNVADYYRDIFAEIDNSVRTIDKDIYDSPRVRSNIDAIKSLLGKVSYTNA